MAIIGAETRSVADRRFAELGLTISFGEHVEEIDDLASTTPAARVADLHAALADPAVDAVLTAIGGYNANQLLPLIDWDLVGAHPKIICGFSDITILTCAIHAATGIVTYSGPHYSTFGMSEHFGPTLDWFIRCLFTSEPYSLEAATDWTDDEWYLDQANRCPRPNEGHWVLSGGQATGRLVGGNLCTLNLLNGTAHLPTLDGTVLFVEDDFESHPATFGRHLTALSQQPGFDGIQGMLIGRFQLASNMTRSLLDQIVSTLPLHSAVPVVANLDFGHTDPLCTLPVGGTATIDADEIAHIVITEH